MRIISGKSRGATLFAPRGMETRPLSDMMRGAIFSRLGGAVVDATVLDLFAGTGAVGLEALSRGAASATLVERSREGIKVIERNLASAKALDRESVEIVCGDVFGFIEYAAKAGRQFDIIFAGPPYAKLPGQTSLAQKLLQAPALADIVSRNGCVIIEHFKKEEIQIVPPWRLTRTLGHGDTRVEFLSCQK